MSPPPRPCCPHRRVAEHDKDVQQLCEVLEQQIQQEQLRLQQQVGPCPLAVPVLAVPGGTQHPKAHPAADGWVGASVLVPPQSMARSQQHGEELQRVLDASEREVQRLVTAQMEVGRTPLVCQGSLGCAVTTPRC